jgi:hypothetical protein
VKNILDAGPLITALNRVGGGNFKASRLGPPFYSCPEAIAEAAAMTEKPEAILVIRIALV